MGLRAKLFLTIGTILIIYILLVLFVPTYIVIQDVEVTSQEIYSSIIDNNERLVRAEELLISDVFEEMRESIASFMVAVSFIDNVKNLLGPKQTLNVWQVMVDGANYNPQYGLFQIDDIAHNQTLLFAPSDAKLYQPVITPIEGKVTVVEIDGKIYFGILIDLAPDSLLKGEFYALLEQDKLSKLPELERSIAAFEKKYGGGQGINLGASFLSNVLPPVSANDWAQKNLLIQILTPLLFVNDELALHPSDLPTGLAYIAPDKTHQAILTNELFFSTAAFDAPKFFANHSPLPGHRPVATEDFFIAPSQLRLIYMGTTVKTNYMYLSIGMPIDPLARELSRWTNKTVVLSVGDRINIYGEAKGLYSDSKLKKELFSSGTGTVVIQGKTYFFANLARLENGKINFYLLTPLENHNALANAALKSIEGTAKKISIQLFILSLIIAGALFLALSRLAMRTIIKPLIKLAAATDRVTEGQYDQVELPSVGRSKDEVAHLILDFDKMVKGLQEKERIRGVLNKVVSKEIADEILRSQILLGGEERELTVLFGDIRNFTGMTEYLPPKETIELLNLCMTDMTNIVDQNGGIVDKYVGDEIMVLYGVPLPKPNHAEMAVKTAIEIQRSSQQLNEQRKIEGKPTIGIGIGIHTGVAVAGNMGAANRLNYTVVGTTINIGARLCQAAQPGQILISEATAKQLGKGFKVELLPPISLKGISAPVSVYQVLIS